MAEDWFEYWREKGTAKTKSALLVSGYDVGLSKITPSGRKEIIAFLKKTLGLNKNDRLLDVGCGAGLWAVPLASEVREIVGVDQSPSMMARVPKTIETHQAFADRMPFPGASFDKVLCFSIFQYFPDEAYAKGVVKEMIRVCRPGGKILICDLPDAALRDAYGAKKKKETHGLTRTFYDKSMFEQFGSVIQKIYKGYGNSQYRFNVLIEVK